MRNHLIDSPLADLQEYGCSDLGLATALLCCKQRILRIESIEGSRNRKRIVFRRNSTLLRMVEEYWQARLTVPAITYQEEYKKLKGQLSSDYSTNYVRSRRADDAL